MKTKTKVVSIGELLDEAKNNPLPKIGIPTIKFIMESNKGNVTTFRTYWDKDIKEIIKSLNPRNLITEAYIGIEVNGKYTEIYIDIDRYQ